MRRWSLEDGAMDGRNAQLAVIPRRRGKRKDWLWSGDWIVPSAHDAANNATNQMTAAFERVAHQHCRDGAETENRKCVHPAILPLSINQILLAAAPAAATVCLCHDESQASGSG
jgi:hypothetical protein